jgi:hypothetical protein
MSAGRFMIGESYMACGDCGARMELHMGHVNEPCRFCAMERRIAALEARLAASEGEEPRPLGCVHGREWCMDCGWRGGPPQ